MEKGQWHTAVPPQARPSTGLSPVDYFGRKMVDNLPDSIKVGTITVAVGGASIDLFDKRTYKAYLKKQPDWMKNFASQYHGNPYARLIRLAKIARSRVSSRVSFCTRVKPTMAMPTGLTG